MWFAYAHEFFAPVYLFGYSPFGLSQDQRVSNSIQTIAWFSSYLLFLGSLFGLNFPFPGTSVREGMTAQAEHLSNSSIFGFYSILFSSHFIAFVHFYYPSLCGLFFNFITFLFSPFLPMI